MGKRKGTFWNLETREALFLSTRMSIQSKMGTSNEMLKDPEVKHKSKNPEALIVGLGFAPIQPYPRSYMQPRSHVHIHIESVTVWKVLQPRKQWRDDWSR
jgi:hypothetical protein